MCEGHEIFSLVWSVTNHQTLVTCSDVLFLSVHMHSFCDFTRLLIKSHDDSASTVIHADISWFIANFFDGLSGNLFDIGLCFSANLSKNHANGIFDCGLACHHGVWIFRKTGIENWIRDVIAEFIRMTTGNTLRCEEEMSLLGCEMLFLHN